jgi:predicted pyridoxine 5'-phosphate oxidase superfamily flavin-nucleotide-binding protein
MSDLYGDRHRALQDRFETRQLADRIEQAIVGDQLSEQTQAFVASRDMFFLSTIDHLGRPTVSYKGGDPGFLRVVNERELAFPSYDGNGMYLSLGNIAGNPQVGLLLIDFENPLRVRIQGTAAIIADDPLLAEYPEAELVVRVAVRQTWINCPRYIHRYRKEAPSRYVPRRECETPYAEWKRIDFLQDALAPRDAGRAAAAGGTLTMAEWAALVARGEG